MLFRSRSGIKTVILPKENRKDLQDIDPTVAAGLRFVPVETIDAVLAEALDYPALPAAGGQEDLNGLFPVPDQSREHIRQ